MEYTEQIEIDRLLRTAGGIAMSKQEVSSVSVEGIDCSSQSGKYQAAFFVCTMRQDKLSSEYRPLKQVKTMAEKSGQQIDTTIKEDESPSYIPYFAGGL